MFDPAQKTSLEAVVKKWSKENGVHLERCSEFGDNSMMLSFSREDVELDLDPQYPDDKATSAYVRRFLAYTICQQSIYPASAPNAGSGWEQRLYRYVRRATTCSLALDKGSRILRANIAASSNQEVSKLLETLSAEFDPYMFGFEVAPVSGALTPTDNVVFRIRESYFSND